MKARTAQHVESDSQRVTAWTAEMAHWVALGEWSRVRYLASAVATVAARLSTD